MRNEWIIRKKIGYFDKYVWTTSRAKRITAIMLDGEKLICLCSNDLERMFNQLYRKTKARVKVTQTEREGAIKFEVEARSLTTRYLYTGDRYISLYECMKLWLGRYPAGTDLYVSITLIEE